MKRSFHKLSLSALLLALFAGAVPQAHADLVVIPPSPAAVGAALYDALGIPIWGYGSRGRAIYAYDPAGLPIYSFNRVYSGCYVPNWGFHARYHGPRHPHGCHFRPHGFRPAPPPPAPSPRHRHKEPGPKARPHGPQPVHHARPARDAHRAPRQGRR